MEKLNTNIEYTQLIENIGYTITKACRNS